MENKPCSGLYYKPCEETPINLELMKVIDQEYTRYPFYGTPRMTEHLKKMGFSFNIKRIRKLYHMMALRAIYPKPRTTIADKEHYKYTYLLQVLVIDHPSHAIFR